MRRGTEVDPVDLAYAAGIIDGEGTIGITEYAVRKDRKSPQFRCYVSMAMTDPTLPMWFAQSFGGTAHGYDARQPQQKGFTRWAVQNRKAADVCALLLPYLRLKKQQAHLLVNFYADPRLDFTRHGGRGPQISEVEIEARREYTDNIRVLNRRGV